MHIDMHTLELWAMKDRYDFSKAQRGRVFWFPEPEPEGKTGSRSGSTRKLWIAFSRWAEQSGGATGYQTLTTRRCGNTWREKRRGSRTRCDGIIREELTVERA